VGIGYEHRRELGNPKTNRAGFAGTPSEMAEARSTFQELLRQPEADRALDAVAAAARTERVALLCYEADQNHCHRDVILDETRRRDSALSFGPDDLGNSLLLGRQPFT